MAKNPCTCMDDIENAMMVDMCDQFGDHIRTVGTIEDRLDDLMTLIAISTKIMHPASSGFIL
jgi:hypothetical protein